MKTLEEIKVLYPDIGINTDGETDAFNENFPIIERDPIAVIIKHPTENKYLVAEWKQTVWNGFLTGGIEEGDTLEQTVQKEIHEESGYKNISKVVQTDFVSHGLFFHVVKKVNRLAHYHLVFAQLGNLDRDEVSEEEKAIADFNWYEEQDVMKKLTRDNMQILWQYYLENKQRFI